ncbi:MAG: GNAT family N-acetyltransferase [Clostridia bacterium]|nr:GNAT family N-acetyltransferase [Clostridia bacterium]
MEYLLETARLRARAFRPGDAARLYAIHLEDNVRQWIPNESYADLAEAEDAVRFFADCVNAGRLPFVLAVETREGELIGDTGVNEVDGQPGEVEIGYVISGRFSGQGLATELVGAMTVFAAARFGVSALYGRVMRGNSASERVLQKNGYALAWEETGAEDDPYGRGMLVYVKISEKSKGAEP